MTAPYIPRLVSIGLAVFFLMHLGLGVLVAALAPFVSRLASRIRASHAARLLLVLRLLPACGSSFVVLVLCVPSFLRFETVSGDEEVGWGCLAAAILGAAIWCISLARGLRAAGRSILYVRRCQRAACRLILPREPAPVWVLDRAEPFVMLAGLFRPRLVISLGVLNSLSAEQLGAALEHERAHWTGRDNLKRLMLVLAPGLLPFIRGFVGLEKSWARFVEWAADDLAVAGDSQRSLSLAGALVRVARMGIVPPPRPLVTSLLADPQELAARVDRLLHALPPRDVPRSWTAASVVLTAAIVLVTIQPATLRAVHGLLERLVH